MSRTLARDPLLHSAGTPPEEGLLRNVSQMLVTRTAPAPFDVTPPQTPDKHMTPARRASPQMREHSLDLSSPDPESEPAPEPVRRKPLIFTTQNVEPRPSTHERESPREVGQRRHQQTQGHAKPSRSSTNAGNPDHGSQFASTRSFSQPQQYKQEQVRAPQAINSYEDQAPPAAHPALRRASKGSVARTQPYQSLVEDRKPPFVEHSRKSSHGNRLHKKPPPVTPSSASNFASTQNNVQSPWQAQLNGDLPVPSTPRPVPGHNSSSPESSLPPTPPEKSPPRLGRSEWLHHMKSQSLPQPIVPTDDVEIEPRDIRKGWALPTLPVNAQSEEDDPINVEDDQEGAQGTHLLNGFSLRESPSTATSSTDEDSLRGPGQRHDGSYDSVVDPSGSQLDDTTEVTFAEDPRYPQNTTRHSVEDDGIPLEVSILRRRY
jgi:hypothetical protein